MEKLYDRRAKFPRGSRIRNYVLQPYTLAKDVRTEVQTAQVGDVLDGDMTSSCRPTWRKARAQSASGTHMSGERARQAGSGNAQ